MTTIDLTRGSHKGDNHFIRMDNSVASSLIIWLSILFGQRGTEGQTLWWQRRSENCCKELATLVARWLVWSWDWKRWWLCWQVGMRTCDVQLHLDVQYVWLYSLFLLEENKLHYFLTRPCTSVIKHCHSRKSIFLRIFIYKSSILCLSCVLQHLVLTISPQLIISSWKHHTISASSYLVSAMAIWFTKSSITYIS